MSETQTETKDAPKKGGKIMLILGVLLALVAGGGAFYVVRFDPLQLLAQEMAEGEMEMAAPEPVTPLPEMQFVALDPMLVSLGPVATRQVRHLRFAATLEVHPQYAEEVEQLRPRLADVLTTYLRAVDTADLEDPAALVRLRAQMLRRMQVVSGQGRVRDILITEFVLS
ncbi:flagellar basal body-associated FliL family protein [Pontivivens ytuae]